MKSLIWVINQIPLMEPIHKFINTARSPGWSFGSLGGGAGAKKGALIHKLLPDKSRKTICEKIAALDLWHLKGSQAGVNLVCRQK